MGRSAYIKLVEGSTQQDITLDQIKALLKMFSDRSAKSGEQLQWGEYDESAFPYTIEERDEDGTKYLFLKGMEYLYNYLIIGKDSETVDGVTRNYIQVVLPNEDNITPGDSSKGTILVKYLGKYLKAETHLFNGRIIYNNPRK